MTDQELIQLRREKWRLDGRPIRTLDEAREWIESVGFCLMYPLPRQETRVPVLAPTFMGAFVGGDDHLPSWQMAFQDPRAAEATELMVRLLRERAAYEANLFGESGFLVAGTIFPFFHGLVGERNPRAPIKAGARSPHSQLAVEAFDIIQSKGPICKSRLREQLGREPSGAALDRALNDLWSKLRITRVDYNPAEGAFWDALFRWSPEAVREGMNVSVPEALSALLSKYLDCVVAAEAAEVEEFFSHLVARSRVKEAINALLAAREFTLTYIGRRTLLQLTPPRIPAEERVPHAPRRTIRNMTIPSVNERR